MWSACIPQYISQACEQIFPGPWAFSALASRRGGRPRGTAYYCCSLLIVRGRVATILIKAVIEEAWAVVCRHATSCMDMGERRPE